jgi:hypothetical protein
VAAVRARIEIVKLRATVGCASAVGNRRSRTSCGRGRLPARVGGSSPEALVECEANTCLAIRPWAGRVIGVTVAFDHEVFDGRTPMRSVGGRPGLNRVASEPICQPALLLNAALAVE